MTTTDEEDAAVDRRLRDVRVATTLELIDDLAPTADVARRVRVRVASVYGFARATVEDVRTTAAALTPPDQEAAP